MNTESLISELKESPLFNLSLSSKELFHSNFLAWICEKYPITFGKILSRHLGISENDSKNGIIKVYREQKKIDLILEFECKRIIIENKVKSVPDKEQLIDYKKKNSTEDLFLLLTLIPPTFDIKECGWEIITYGDLSEMLSELKDSLDSNDYYSSYLLEDYISFINNLENIIGKLSFNPNSELYDYYGLEYSLFQQIRLHDLYIKYKYNQIVTEIYKYLKLRLKDTTVSKGIRYSHEMHKYQLVISSTLVNGKGVVNIDYSKDDEIIFGIMLDGARYNHYMYSWGRAREKRYEMANELRIQGKWFSFDSISDDETYPKNGKDFNKFKDMIYRSFKISSNTQINVLLERISKDTIRLMNINTNANSIYK